MGLFVYARVNDGNGKVLKANPLDGMTFVSFHYVNHVSPIILVLAFSYAKHYVCILFYVFVCHLKDWLLVGENHLGQCLFITHLFS